MISPTLLDQAAKCRRLASDILDDAAREALLGLAEDLERRAAEQTEAPPRIPLPRAQS